MQTLFWGVSPSRDLKTVLTKNHFETHVIKRNPSRGRYDLVVFAPTDIASLKKVESLRERLPKAWIAIVVEDSWLRSSDKFHSILRFHAKDDVWTKSDWESHFWLSLQRLYREKSILKERGYLRKELRALKVQFDELTEHSATLVKKLERDITLASKIQKSLLPRFSPEIPGVSILVKYIPAAGLGGDYYDIFEFGDRKRFGVIVADAKTHNIAASLLSVLVKVRLEEMKDRFPDSRSFVEFLDREIQQLHDKQMTSLTLLYGIIDRSNLTFQYTTAGPIKPLLWRDGKAVDLPPSPNPPLGGINRLSFAESQLRLQPKDILICHTDGLDLPLNGKASHEIQKFLKNQKELPEIREIQNEVSGRIDSFVEQSPLRDDVTFIQFAINDRALYLAPTNSKQSNTQSK